MIRKVAITTIDNPFDPIEQHDDWLYYDMQKGYYSNNKVARLTEIEDDMTSKEEDEAIEKAIDRLVEIDPLNLFKKVVKEVDE